MARIVAGNKIEEFGLEDEESQMIPKGGKKINNSSTNTSNKRYFTAAWFLPLLLLLSLVIYFMTAKFLSNYKNEKEKAYVTKIGIRMEGKLEKSKVFNESLMQYLYEEHDETILAQVNNQQTDDKNIITDILKWEKNENAENLLTSMAQWFENIAETWPSYTLTTAEKQKLSELSTDMEQLSSIMVQRNMTKDEEKTLKRAHEFLLVIAKQSSLKTEELIKKLSKTESVPKAYKDFGVLLMSVEEAEPLFQEYRMRWEKVAKLLEKRTNDETEKVYRERLQKCVDMLVILEKGIENNPRIDFLL
eukprot:CAMPEP_0204893438 /NCGR_PEP_ID=MMETSP1349-20130617/31494_1 /ASSEMBLY_ACC=CAM_ASM_000710 /TAXON_ID=215587 /ORGANISM="Aplanochytrium stocchinoi, Strain GSBS06" /LENGTH=303 /DNA_ID=CAMNT_0052060029 /DNA_START=58 /DNA_END=966 /DNA_ORIENTATION=-